MESKNSVLTYLINTVIWVAMAILGLRIILKFFGANPATPFVAWVYKTSMPLLEPFAGAFPTPTVDGVFTLEFSALFALIVYAVIGTFLVKLTQMLESGFGMRKSKEK